MFSLFIIILTRSGIASFFISILVGGLLILNACNSKRNGDESIKFTPPPTFFDKLRPHMPMEHFKTLFGTENQDCQARLQHTNQCVYKFTSIPALKQYEWTLSAVPTSGGNLQRVVLFNQFQSKEAEYVYSMLKEYFKQYTGPPSKTDETEEAQEVKWETNERMIKISNNRASDNMFSIVVYYMYKN